MKTVFLDRDGVINKNAAEHHHIKSVAELHVLPHAAPAIKKLNDRGFRVLIVSNQQGVAKGTMTYADLDDISKEIEKRIAAHGAKIDGWYYCTHHKDENCACRKPKVGLFLQAQKEHGVDFSKTWFVGDSESDEHAAQTLAAHGLKFIRMPRDGSLLEAIQPILKE